MNQLVPLSTLRPHSSQTTSESRGYLASLRPTAAPVARGYAASSNALQGIAQPAYATPRIGSFSLHDGAEASGVGDSAPSPSPDEAAAEAEAAIDVMGAIGSFGTAVSGVPGLGTLGTIGAAAAGTHGVDQSFEAAYGFSPQTSTMSAASNAMSFGAIGHSLGNQVAANTPGIADSGFGPNASSSFGSGNHPGETDGVSGVGGPGGSTGSAGSDAASGAGSDDGPGGGAGSDAGPFHEGGAVYDGDPTQLRDNIQATVQEGEYVMPRYVVDKFGMEFLDNIRRAASPDDDFQLGEGELKGMRERIQRHPDIMSRLDGMSEAEFKQMRAASGVILRLLPELSPLLEQGQENI